MELSISSTGPVELRRPSNNITITCGTSAYPSSTVGIAAVGVEGVGPVKNLDAYFDNVVVSIRR